MSINFYISGDRYITVNKTGAIEIQHTEYQPWQTPSDVTREILASMLPVEAYKAYIMSISEDEKEPIYHESDIHEECRPVGYNTVNYGKEECAQVDEWIAAVVALGYELRFYSL